MEKKWREILIFVENCHILTDMLKLNNSNHSQFLVTVWHKAWPMMYRTQAFSSRCTPTPNLTNTLAVGDGTSANQKKRHLPCIAFTPLAVLN